MNKRRRIGDLETHTFRDGRLLIALSVLAFVLRLGYAAHSGSLRAPQVWEQEEIATNLIDHHTFAYEGGGAAPYRAYTEPMYPFVAAGVYLLTGHSLMAMVLLQLVMASITVWLAGRLAAVAAGDDAAGAVAALLLAVHPGFIRYSSVLHPLVFDTFFFTAAALALVRYRQQPTFRRGLAAAALIGLGALTRPTILVLLLPLAWIAWRSRAGVWRTILLVVTTLAVVAPWTIRNAVVLHHFVMTRSGTGLVFWLGNNPYSTGSAMDANGRPVLYSLPPAVQTQLKNADELTRDGLLRHAAMDYIRAHPAAAVGRVVQRLGYFWWFSPQWGAGYSATAKIVYRGWWLVILLLIAAGGFVARRRTDLWLLAGIAVLVSLGQSLYYVEGRHRLSIEPLVLPLAAVGVLYVIRKMLNIVKTGRTEP
jgi:4-amino-4-deoxy-L-arabinose transferase-like glycosyltransferase